jgi:hypothetical protein
LGSRIHSNRSPQPRQVTLSHWCRCHGPRRRLAVWLGRSEMAQSRNGAAASSCGSVPLAWSAGHQPGNRNGAATVGCGDAVWPAPAFVRPIMPPRCRSQKLRRSRWHRLDVDRRHQAPMVPQLRTAETTTELRDCWTRQPAATVPHLSAAERTMQATKRSFSCGETFLDRKHAEPILKPQ